MKKAIYPGTFDPITNGHIDVIKRALKIFDGLVICVMINPNKKSLFSIEERMNMVRASVKDIDNCIEVSHFGGLLVDYVKKVGIFSVVRGLRAFRTSSTNFKWLWQIESYYPGWKRSF